MVKDLVPIEKPTFYDLDTDELVTLLGAYRNGNKIVPLYPPEQHAKITQKLWKRGLLSIDQTELAASLSDVGREIGRLLYERGRTRDDRW